ncbi:hypothetical protein MKX01_003973, partial [Papaver californicum]
MFTLAAPSITTFLHLLSLLLLLFIPYTSSSSLSQPSSTLVEDEQPQTYIVHALKSDKPSNFASHHELYHSILQSLPPSPHPKTIIYT